MALSAEVHDKVLDWLAALPAKQISEAMTSASTNLTTPISFACTRK
jgi:hypothetical protein